MREFRTKMGEDGRVVIPAPCRKMLALLPGEELVIRVENNALCLQSLKQALKKAQTVVQGYAKKRSLVQDLLQLREKEQ